MRIIIDRNEVEERQSAIIEIDTKKCYYPYAIREAIELALSLDGFTDDSIDEIFGRVRVECKQPTQE